jgi:hypothetical protein
VPDSTKWHNAGTHIWGLAWMAHISCESNEEAWTYHEVPSYRILKTVG